jgi:hypothetical protein
VSRIIRLTESDLTRIVKNVIMMSNKEKSILKEDCVQSMALINPRTGKPAYIDTITGKYCNPYDAKGFNGMPIDYDPITKTGLLAVWIRSYPCVPYDKRFKRVSVEPTEYHGPIAFDFNNNDGSRWRYYDSGIKQRMSDVIRGTDPAKFGDEVTVTGGKFSCKDQEFKVVNQACKTKSQTALSKAVSFWKNWLNDPITKEKVYLNYLVRSEREMNNVNNDFKKYFDILNNLNLIYFDQTMPDEDMKDLAYVIPDLSLYDVHINCSSNDTELVQTLVHEIQHLLYEVKPLNPAKKINNAFVDKNKKSETIGGFFKNLLSPLIQKNFSKIIKDTSKKLNIPYYDLEFWKDLSIETAKDEDPGYICRENEKMSNIMAIRSLFGIKAGGKITLNMIMPYIKLEKDSGNISWLLLCWAERGFPDINGMLDDINKLAFKQGDEPPKMGDLPKPNFS